MNLYKVIGGGHQWPGTSSLFGGLGAINRDISASAEIWNFFRRFSCPIPSAVSELDASASEFVLEQDYTLGTVTVRHHGNGIFQISMYDLTGKLMIKEFNTQTWTMHSGSSPRGVYLLKCVSGKTAASFKVVMN